MRHQHAHSIRIVCGLIYLSQLFAVSGFCQDNGLDLAGIFQQQVDRKLDVPESEQRKYVELLAASLGSPESSNPQYVVLVDRNPFVQAAMIFRICPDGAFDFIGASPVSTGKPGKFDHFVTPIGVFAHTVDNLDFRSEGTRNEFGIRGYGRKGLRVYDFGWQKAEKGWDGRGEGTLRLQMHGTDPDHLESKLGTPQSKGCVRIPATLNTFVDVYGILDGDYEAAMAQGETFWVLLKTRVTIPWSGKFLVVVDTGRKNRPTWSPYPISGRNLGKRLRQ
jgi:hypothetical protein